jgi:hypothetical protein
MALSTHGQPCSAPKRSTSTGAPTSVNGGTATPSSASRVRITSLSWACSSAGGAGCRRTPPAASWRNTGCGTCSWSKVSTSQPAANERTTSRSVYGPTTTSLATSAAGSFADEASTRSDWPSATAAWWVILASWPAPTIPTTGVPVRGSTARGA